ncbi:4'-phosphopantetheinyl transferase superfamily protein [Shimia sp.]|uniref:4'-phosphopantetheinyl transferase family protein n=1 Tax=Shimia sp. TaxID=1954381 RepID=UPI003299BEA8
MIEATNHLDQLQARARVWAPEGVAVAVSNPLLPAEPVWPQEAPAIAHAVPARRREFAAGRHAARQAMSELSLEPRAIPGARNRAPQWPRGLTGSISHDGASCVVVMALTSQFRALGVDVEPNAPLPEDLVPEICIPSERAWLASLPATQRHGTARRIFCAKEAVYKAQFPLTRLLFGFDAVEIYLHEDDQFTATFRRTVGAIRAGSTLSGHCGAVGGHILAMVTLGAEQGSQNADFPVSAIG